MPGAGILFVVKRLCEAARPWCRTPAPRIRPNVLRYIDSQQIEAFHIGGTAELVVFSLVLQPLYDELCLSAHAPASAAITALRKEPDERMTSFSASTRRNTSPPRKSHGQTRSGIASWSNRRCKGGA